MGRVSSPSLEGDGLLGRAPRSRLPSAPTAGWAQLDVSDQKVFLQHSVKIFVSLLILHRVIYDSESDQLSYNLSGKASAGVNQCLFPTHEMAKSFVTGWRGVPGGAGLLGVPGGAGARGTAASPARRAQLLQNLEKQGKPIFPAEER